MGVAKYRGGRWSARRGKGEGRRECRQNRIGQAALGVQTTVSVRLRCVALRCVAELRPGRIVLAKHGAVCKRGFPVRGACVVHARTAAHADTARRMGSQILRIALVVRTTFLVAELVAVVMLTM